MLRWWLLISTCFLPVRISECPSSPSPVRATSSCPSLETGTCSRGGWLRLDGSALRGTEGLQRPPRGLLRSPRWLLPCAYVLLFSANSSLSAPRILTSLEHITLCFQKFSTFLLVCLPTLLNLFWDLTMSKHGVEEEWNRYVDPPNNPGLYRACWSFSSGTQRYLGTRGRFWDPGKVS